MMNVITRDLQLGDVVCQKGNEPEAFSTGIVSQSIKGYVTIVRVTAETLEFCGPNGAQVYPRTELVQIPLEDSTMWRVYDRKTLR